MPFAMHPITHFDEFIYTSKAYNKPTKKQDGDKLDDDFILLAKYKF